MSAHYFRCSHCRGFYEQTLPNCRYCGKDVPIKGPHATPQVFPDRPTCRAIQIAEYEQLPPAAHQDHCQPDPELLDNLCYCLHCGQDAPYFEAVEMRWMVNEAMWACPCTTCGGRGFGFDIHLVERLWQCAQCQHWYVPANGDFRGSNAKCPKCGSIHASGWFDDEYDEDEEAAAADEPAADSGPDPVAAAQSANEAPGQLAPGEESLPWEDQVENPFDSGPARPEKMPDDIDFPR